MFTEVIEKSIKIDYLKRYYKQLQERNDSFYERTIGMSYKQREEYLNTDEGIRHDKESAALWRVNKKLKEMEIELLNAILREIGVEEIKPEELIDYQP